MLLTCCFVVCLLRCCIVGSVCVRLLVGLLCCFGVVMLCCVSLCCLFVVVLRCCFGVVLCCWCASLFRCVFRLDSCVRFCYWWLVRVFGFDVLCCVVMLCCNCVGVLLIDVLLCGCWFVVFVVCFLV